MPVTMQAETDVMLPQAKEHPRTLSYHQKLGERPGMGLPSLASKGSTPGFGLSTS